MSRPPLHDSAAYPLLMILAGFGALCGWAIMGDGHTWFHTVGSGLGAAAGSLVWGLVAYG